MNDQELAARIVRQLDLSLEDLPPRTVYRLRAAREAALARASGQESVAPAPVRFGARGQTLSMLNRRLLVPVFALIVGLSAVLLWRQDTPPSSDYAELDAQVLADELPVTAYLDTGFEIWLYHHTAD